MNPSSLCIFLACLFGCLVMVDNSTMNFDGEVMAGNYSYYSVRSSEIFQLTLVTHSGDADLYVSDTLAQPTFDFLDHNMSSTTYGIDTILVTKEYKRPVFVAVYGHPRFEKSQYTIQISILPEESDPFERFVLKEIQEEYEYPEYSESGDEDEKIVPKLHPTEPKKKSWDFIVEIILELMALLVDILV